MKTISVLFAKFQILIGKIALVLSLVNAIAPDLHLAMATLVEPHLTTSKWLEIRQVEDEAILELSCDLRGTGVTHVAGVEVSVRKQWIAENDIAFGLMTEGSWLFGDVAPVVTLTAKDDWYRVRLALPDGACTIGHGHILSLDFREVMPADFDPSELIQQVKPDGIVILDDMIL